MDLGSRGYATLRFKDSCRLQKTCSRIFGMRITIAREEDVDLGKHQSSKWCEEFIFYEQTIQIFSEGTRDVGNSEEAEVIESAAHPSGTKMRFRVQGSETRTESWRWLQEDIEERN